MAHKLPVTQFLVQTIDRRPKGDGGLLISVRRQCVRGGMGRSIKHLYVYMFDNFRRVIKSYS